MNETAFKPAEVVSFWRNVGPKGWFEKNPALDEEILRRFLALHEAAAAGRLASWENSAEGALALLILLDQFPRNMFRGGAEAFSTDAMARTAAREAVARGFDVEAPAGVRSFFYLPLMHSESLEDQETCVRLTRECLGEDHFSFPYAVRHHDTIRRFGRFPARNAVLGRPSTPEERNFLETNPIGF
jgi:uncharacterized protein (DUF924 family)